MTAWALSGSCPTGSRALPSSPVSSQRWGDVGLVKPSAPVIPCATGIPKVPISPDVRGPASKKGRCQPSSHHPVALPPVWGKEGEGLTEEGEKAPEHAWSLKVALGETLPADTPPCEGCKKKKKLVLPFCLLPAQPHGPPRLPAASAAHPVSGFPLLSAEPLGGLGFWMIGVGEGCRGRGGDGVIACLCGTWAVVRVWGVLVGGQNEPNEAEAGGVGGGLGSVCSLRLG